MPFDRYIYLLVMYQLHSLIVEQCFSWLQYKKRKRQRKRKRKAEKRNPHNSPMRKRSMKALDLKRVIVSSFRQILEEK